MIGIIPQPNSIQLGSDKFIISDSVSIFISDNNSELMDVAKLIVILIENAFNKQFQVNTLKDIDDMPSNSIILKILKDKQLKNKEGYRLSISKDLILIEAINVQGIFYGFQTLRQILPADFEISRKFKNKTLALDTLVIEDSPRFSWRGFMVDEGRYFLGKEAIKKVIDFLAMLKFNRFHWHLTEDQGWRVEIKKYPKLTEIGSKRKGTPKLRNLNKRLDGIPHEGYYSQEDLKEIVDYAKNQFIEIIPEIEMPGHCQSALASYPELSCTGGPFEVHPFWGVNKNVFCAGKEIVYQFNKDVLDEILPIFPSPWIHIGGDEVPKDRWKKCDNCQAMIAKENLKDEHDLQLYFTNYMVNYLRQKGRKTICWNEVVDEKLDIDTICQYWRGKFSEIVPFLESGGKTIISPSGIYYVDVSYDSCPLKKTYEYEPVPEDLSKEVKSNTLGLEGEMWGEVFNSLEKLEWCAFPRILGISESSWTYPLKKNYDVFVKKVAKFNNRLINLGINHATLSEADPRPLQRIKNRIKRGFGHYIQNYSNNLPKKI